MDIGSMSMDELFTFFEDLLEGLRLGYGYAELGLSGIMLIISVIGAIVTAIVAVVIYVLEAIPLYALAKKAGRKYAWLAWIPVLGLYFRLYTLADIPGERQLRLFGGKLVVKSRPVSFWIYVGIDLLGGTVITILIGVLSAIPVVGVALGALTALLYLAPSVVTAIMEYAYLRDVLDLFKEDRKANNTASIIVTALDATVTGGFARMIYLYTLLKKEPLPQPEEEPIPEKAWVIG